MVSLSNLQGNPHPDARAAGRGAGQRRRGRPQDGDALHRGRRARHDPRRAGEEAGKGRTEQIPKLVSIYNSILSIIHLGVGHQTRQLVLRAKPPRPHPRADRQPGSVPTDGRFVRRSRKAWVRPLDMQYTGKFTMIGFRNQDVCAGIKL